MSALATPMVRTVKPVEKIDGRFMIDLSARAVLLDWV
jgi:hypothetical protein